MTRQRFLAKQQCVKNVIVVDALDVTRNRAVSLECACSAEIVYWRCDGDTVIKYSWKTCTMLLCIAIIGTTQIHLPSEPASTLPVARGSCGFAGITDLPPVEGSPFSLSVRTHCSSLVGWSRTLALHNSLLNSNSTTLRESLPG